MIVFITTIPRETDQINIFATIQNLFNIVVVLKKKRKISKSYLQNNPSRVSFPFTEREGGCYFISPPLQRNLRWGGNLKKKKKNPNLRL